MKKRTEVKGRSGKKGNEKGGFGFLCVLHYIFCVYVVKRIVGMGCHYSAIIGVGIPLALV